MAGFPAGLVDIVRDFLVAHRLVRDLFARYRRGELRFAELEELVGDDESSVLFRLKERCHALFRIDAGSSSVGMHRGALLDLAVGSLFHEAMKFRESFYQREVYAPRVRALRSEAGAEADALFREFERMLAGVSERLEEGLQETKALLDQTQQQLRILLVEHREHGQVTRFLLENASLVEEVFARSLDALLAEIHDDAAEGYALAGRSYLASGYYESAERVFAAAIERGARPDDLEPCSAYARGMAAFLAGDYATVVECLRQWVDAGATGDETLTDLAYAAVLRSGQMVEGDRRERVVAEAAELLERIGSARSAGEAGDAAARRSSDG